MGESHVARISRPSNQATSFMSLRLYKNCSLGASSKMLRPSRLSINHGRNAARIYR
jgi:hypothetical protein